MIEIYRAARDLLAQPGVWRKGLYFGDENGRGVPIGAAKCFCAAGAIAKISGAPHPQDLRPAFLEPLAQAVSEDPDDCASPLSEIIRFNDQRAASVDDVLAAFDRAIEGMK